MRKSPCTSSTSPNLQTSLRRRHNRIVVGVSANRFIQPSGRCLLIGDDYTLLKILSYKRFSSGRFTAMFSWICRLPRRFLDETSVKHQPSKTLFRGHPVMILVAQHVLIAQFNPAARKPPNKMKQNQPLSTLFLLAIALVRVPAFGAHA